MNKTETKHKQDVVSHWVHLYGDMLFSWAFHKTNEKEISEDLVQETFLSAFKAFDSFKSKSSPQTWLFKILNNKIIDYYRKSAKSLVKITHSSDNDGIQMVDSYFDKFHNWKPNGLEDAWVNDAQLLDNKIFIKTLGNCLDKLPSNWRAAITAKYLLEKKSKEICQELKITPSNYWQILHRAKLALKKCLETRWFNT